MIIINMICMLRCNAALGMRTTNSQVDDRTKPIHRNFWCHDKINSSDINWWRSTTEPQSGRWTIPRVVGLRRQKDSCTHPFTYWFGFIECLFMTIYSRVLTTQPWLNLTVLRMEWTWWNCLWAECSQGAHSRSQGQGWRKLGAVERP